MSTIAEKIVTAILNDLTDRGGLGNEWDAIDSDIQNEIRQTWAEIVDKELEPEEECQNKKACALAGNEGHLNCTPDPELLRLARGGK